MKSHIDAGETRVLSIRLKGDLAAWLAGKARRRQLPTARYVENILSDIMAGDAPEALHKNEGGPK